MTIAAKVVRNESQLVGSSVPTCFPQPSVLRSCFGSFLGDLQERVPVQERKRKMSWPHLNLFGLTNQVGSESKPSSIYTGFAPVPSFFLFPFTKKPCQKWPPCFLSSFFRSQLQNGRRRCFSHSSELENNLNKERPCLCFTNDSRVPFSGKVLTVVHSLPSPKPVFLFSSITITLFSFFSSLNSVFT